MIYVVITSVRGSAPRDAGTAIAVSADATEGTIGGGALEYRAIARARALLAEGREAEETVALGPGLGQCCGGAVTLRYTFEPYPVDLPLVPHALPVPIGHAVWLWGAGHVGRSFVRLGQGFKITWVDDEPARFPVLVPEDVQGIVAADMPLLASNAEQEADHLIFTSSHEIDLTLCAALLKRDVRSIGLIGSETKWARFSKRLGAMGLDPTRITCPIGDKSQGKHPDAIARSTLEQLLTRSEAHA